MASITLTSLFANLNRWPGHLLENWNQTINVTTKTATTFSYVFDAGDPNFANYRVTVSGTGFQYDSQGAIGGTMTQVRIFDPSGSLVLTIGNLAADTLASDFSQFYSTVFGSKDINGNGPGPDGTAAWSHLLIANDVINGTSGDDRIGLPGINLGNDTFNMGAGDDFVFGGSGNDTMNGGAGYDTLSYSETAYVIGVAAYKGIDVNMTTGVVLDPWGGRDVFTGFEEVHGSRFNDSFIGSDTQRDRFMGSRGRDTLDGGANSFDATGTIRTDDRRDEARYFDDYWHGGRRGIIVDLETNTNLSTIRGTIRDGFGNIDIVIDIERVVGTRFNDVFVGSRADNAFAGAEGVDSYDGQGGFDILNFGWWLVNNPPTGVVVDLARASGQIQNDGFGNVETAVGMEGMWGTNANDRFSGAAQGEFIEGGMGADTLTGRGGVDEFYWDGDFQLDAVDRITDFTTTGASADRLVFYMGGFQGMTGTAVVVNGNAATQAVGTFIYNAANDTLYWDQDGTGGAQRVAVAVLNNVASLSAANFDIWN